MGIKMLKNFIMLTIFAGVSIILPLFLLSFLLKVPENVKIVRSGYIYDIEVFEFETDEKNVAHAYSLPLAGHIFIYHKLPYWLKNFGFKIEVCNVFYNKESSMLIDYYCNLIGWAFINLNYNDIKWYD